MKTHTLIDRGPLEHRLIVVGIPKHLVPQIVDTWCRWSEHSGSEWTVRRFKSLKVDLIRSHAGLPMLTTYVRKNKRGKYYGWIGALFNWSNCNERNFSRAIQALCIYTSVTSVSTTETQKKKFFDAVSCEAPIGLTSTELTELWWSIDSSIGQRVIPEIDNTLLSFRGSPEKIAPLPHNLGYCPQDSNILKDMTWLDTMGNMEFYMKHKVIYDHVLKGIGSSRSALGIEPYRSHAESYPGLQMDRTCYAGEVHFLQEPGFKLRSIASPYRIHQLATKPLQEALGSIVKDLTWDCTFDQEKAIVPIQNHLRSGKPVYSVDLSSATDYFPLDIQLYVLKVIFGSDNPQVLLFRDVSRLTWKSELGDITWKRGQPLGLNPSFFAFTLTHGCILNWLANNQPGQFYIVGDDVVILDPVLYGKYIDVLNRMSCPYSVEKSITSTCLAEFAGKVITPNGKYPQLKWRKCSDDSFLDLAKLLGPRLRELMSNRQKRVFDLVKDLLPPVGLNISKPGGNFASVYNKTEAFLESVQASAVRSLVDLNRSVQRIAAEDPMAHVLNVDHDTFDKKVRKVFQQTVFSHWLWLEHVSELPQALGLEPRLPLSASPRRISKLLEYERKLRIQ